MNARIKALCSFINQKGGTVRIFVFITLKLAEIGGVVFIPYWLGSFWVWAFVRLGGSGFFHQWLCGVSFTFLSALVVCALWTLIPDLIKLNWRWSKKVLDKIRSDPNESP